MGTLRVESPKTFEEFVTLIGQVKKVAGNPLWYRGASSVNYALQPSLYRRSDIKDPAEWGRLEDEIMLRFSAHSMPFLENASSFTDLSAEASWRMLFFMQHYGVPTRLLDWSENPFISLFFATGGRFKIDRTVSPARYDYGDDAVIWLLNPVGWNKIAWAPFGWNRERIPFSNEPNLRGYRPPLTGIDLRNLPVAMHGAHNNKRIVSQRGAFTIFGCNSAPMDRVYASTTDFNAEELVKVVIEKHRIQEFRADVHSYGVTESVIYPDLDGLAREIKREFGFEG